MMGGFLVAVVPEIDRVVKPAIVSHVIQVLLEVYMGANSRLPAHIGLVLGAVVLVALWWGGREPQAPGAVRFGYETPPLEEEHAVMAAPDEDDPVAALTARVEAMEARLAKLEKNPAENP